MTAESNRKIVEKFYEASNRGDMVTCFNLIADDIIWTNIGTTSLSGNSRGRLNFMRSCWVLCSEV